MGVGALDARVPVVVIYHGGIGALAIARTLGRLGVPMYLVSHTADTPVWHSKYWTGKYVWNFDAPAENTVEFLRYVGRNVGERPVLLTLADWVAVFIEDHAEALQNEFRFPRSSSPHTVRNLANKWGMYVLAKEHGAPTPETAYPRSRQELDEFLRNARFPVILKGADPQLPNFASKTIVDTPDQLIREYEQASAAGPPNFVIQEYIPGDSTSVWMCNAYFGKDSQCRGIFTGQKLRQVTENGIASLAVCHPNETVVRQTIAFMQAVGYQGALGIGWRYDARNGAYYLLDVNARVSGVFRLFRASNGLDTVQICYRELTGQPIPPTSLTPDRKWLLEQDFIVALNAIKQGKLSVREWLESLKGVQETHWFAADDLRPFFAWFRHQAWPILWPMIRNNAVAWSKSKHRSRRQSNPVPGSHAP